MCDKSKRLQVTIYELKGKQAFHMLYWIANEKKKYTNLSRASTCRVKSKEENTKLEEEVRVQLWRKGETEYVNIQQG